ncbi:insulinase family protein, partial [bacterium]|nr:insulinase family protein [bacterium]
QYAVRLPIGKKDILENFEHPALTRFYQDWYRPDLMAVIAVGDFDKKWMEQQIKAKFSGITPHENPKPRSLFNVPDHKKPLFAITPDPEATRTIINLYFKHDISDQETVGDYRLRILEQLFSKMLTQRLTELTQQAEPPFLYAVVGNGNYVRTKKVVYLAALVNDDGINRGIDALYTEARRVQQFGFTGTELERAKKNAIRVMEQLFNERDKTESVRFAEEYVRHFLQNEPIPGIAFEYELYQQHLTGIQLAEINDLARKLTRDENQVVVVGMPEKEGVVIPTESELQAVITAAKDSPVTAYVDAVSDKPLLSKLPTPGKVVSSKDYPYVGVTEWNLSNGLRVVLKPTNFKNDEIKFTAYSPGGYSLCPDSSYIAAITATDLVAEGGIADFTSIELGKLLAGKVVRVGPFISDLSEGMFGSATIQDLETMFQLIYLNFTAPREDSTAYFSYQEKMRGVLTNRSAKPEAAFQDTIDVTLSQNHFRARPWSLDMIDEMDLHESVAFYRDRFADADDFTFIFVGKIDIEKLKPLVEQYLGSLPDSPRDEIWHDVGIDPPAGVIEKTVIRGLEPKSRVSLLFTGDYEWSPENNYAFSSMVDVLRIKLRKAVREDKSGTYGVSVNGKPQRYPDEEYQITISFGCAPDRVDELIGIVWSQLDSLQKNPTEEFYLNKVRETQSRSFEVKIKKNGYWLGRLKQAYWYDLPLESIIEYPKMIEKLDGELVRNAAQKYFDEKNYLKVVLYPESTQ